MLNDSELNIPSGRVKIRDLVELSRPLNGVLAFASVWAGAYMSGGPISIRSTFLVATAAVLALSAGNSLNDYCDIKIDQINKPERPIPSGRISRSQALLFSILLLGLSVMIGFQVNLGSLITIVSVCWLLSIYAFWLKRLPLIGNLVVGILTALTFVAGGIANEVIQGTLPLSVFAFLFTTAREIVKDIEDQVGDQAGFAKTLPLTLGEKSAVWVVLFLIASGVAFSPIPYLIYGYSGLYLFIMIFGVDLVMVFLGIRLFLKPSQSNCAMIQKWMKWNIFVGLLAVCLGKPSRLLPVGV